MPCRPRLSSARKLSTPLMRIFPLDVLLGVIHYLMHVVGAQAGVATVGVGVDDLPGSTFSLIPAWRVSRFVSDTTVARIFPPRSMIPTTTVLSLPPVPVIFCSGCAYACSGPSRRRRSR